ncbi:MAG: hypothetical protein F8N36_15970 [Desulfovibrio sp.]|uniref:hypothetical protein n=1 Tax=Desulfovibrio sp. TaxID=885 RepID=UPI00135E7F18|nr:hypothetical protein [Desulfovibrio sp.]MTJ94336.1 hypothetical protein [Desulfovibrio sp.]
MTFIADGVPLVATNVRFGVKPLAVPESEIVGLLYAAAVSVPDSAPLVDACGLTCTVQLAPLGNAVAPETQVPPASAMKFVGFERIRPTAEDV